MATHLKIDFEQLIDKVEHPPFLGISHGGARIRGTNAKTLKNKHQAELGYDSLEVSQNRLSLPNDVSHRQLGRGRWFQPSWVVAGWLEAEPRPCRMNRGQA